MNNLYIRQHHKIFKSDAVVFSSTHVVAQFRLFPYVLPFKPEFLKISRTYTGLELESFVSDQIGRLC